MALAFQDFRNRSRFELLDGVRAMAIIAVVWHHSGGVDPFLSAFFERGYLGVDLFFLLSGFLITHLLIKEKSRTGTVSIKNFYMRRSLRIFPLYYTFLIFFGVITYLRHRESINAYLSALPYYVFYVSNWAPDTTWQFFQRAWSLAVEEQFYLIWPVVFAFFGTLLSARGVLVLLGVSIIVFTGIFGDTVIQLAQVVVPYRTILLGCLLAIIINNSVGYSLCTKCMGSQWHSAVWLAFLLIFIYLQDDAIVGYSQLTVHLLMALFLGACILREDNFLAPLLSSRIAAVIGTVSYGIYILHGLFYGLTQKIVHYIPIEIIAQSRIAFFVLFLVISVLVALLSYYLYESRFLKLKQRYGSKV